MEDKSLRGSSYLLAKENEALSEYIDSLMTIFQVVVTLRTTPTNFIEYLLPYSSHDTIFVSIQFRCNDR